MSAVPIEMDHSIIEEETNRSPSVLTTAGTKKTSTAMDMAYFERHRPSRLSVQSDFDDSEVVKTPSFVSVAAAGVATPDLEVGGY